MSMQYRSMVPVLLLCASTLLVGAEAQAEAAAQSERYVSLKIGRSTPNDPSASGVTFSLDDGISATAAVGVRLQSSFRLELEGSYRSFDFIKAKQGNTTVALGGNADFTSLMLNGYFDLKNDSPVTPYLFVGFGHAWANAEITAFNRSMSASDDGVAYQSGLGFSYAINNTLSLDLEYRYFLVPVDGADDFSNHEIMGGIRLGF
ncbi:MAG: porin family protein [Magnetococcales bacterium]|nr:porin family protein [Magnetococcales bacterium]